MTQQDWYLSDENHQGLARLLQEQPLINSALSVLQASNVPASNYGTEPVHIALIHAEQVGYQKAIEAFRRLARPQALPNMRPLQEWRRKANPETE